MSDNPSDDHLVEQIHRAFEATPRPHDAFLAGSREGCEPEEAVAPFRGRDWTSLDAAMLDANYTALSFFSEGGLRYFIPAFLVADVRRQLQTADPAFALTHGLCGSETTVEADGRRWTVRHGAGALLNPRRYGAITWLDHARFRLSVFCREEATGIVHYLRWRAAGEPPEGRACIERALDGFWLARAAEAPTSVELADHAAAEQAYYDALMQDRGRRE